MDGAIPDLEEIEIEISVASSASAERLTVLEEVWRQRCPIYLAVHKANEASVRLIRPSRPEPRSERDEDGNPMSGGLEYGLGPHRPFRQQPSTGHTHLDLPFGLEETKVTDVIAAPDLAAIKQRQQATWASGRLPHDRNSDADRLGAKLPGLASRGRSTTPAGHHSCAAEVRKPRESSDVDRGRAVP
jgi:hypothetical protein